MVRTFVSPAEPQEPGEWIGVDLDGTLAQLPPGIWPEIGPPIPAMVDRVKAWLAKGYEVRILTARANPEGFSPQEYGMQIYRIQRFCSLHLGKVLPITCMKDYNMVALWDDRAVRVVRDTGEPCCGAPEKPKCLVPGYCGFKYGYCENCNPAA